MKGKIKTTLLIAVLLISTLTIATPLVSAIPTEVWVDDDAASGWYDATHVHTIQEGITAVDVSGTVYVAAGDYSENVAVGKSLALVGAGSDLVTVISTYAVPAFMVTADNVEISGFTMTGTGIDPEVNLPLAGVYLDSVSGCTISDNVMVGESHGVYLDVGSDGNTITRNDASDNNQGFTVEPHDTTGVSVDNIFIDNIANECWKYGFFIEDGERTTFTGNTVNDNPTGFKFVDGEDNTLNYNDIVGNTEAGVKQCGDNLPAVDLDATLNWWGAFSGPSTIGPGDNIDGAVEYASWLPASMDTYVDEAAAEAAAVDNIPQLVKEYYQIDDIVTVTVYDGMFGIRLAVAETVELDVSSDYPDAITVELTETDLNTGIYYGTFTVVDETPGATDLLVEDGSHVVVTYINDPFVDESATFDIDMLDPEVGTLGPGDGDRISSAVPTISAVLTDSGSGLASITLTLDSTVVALKTYDIPEQTPFTITYTVQAFESLSEGIHTAEVTVSDIAGNTASETWSFTVDLTKPTVSVSVDEDPAKVEPVTFTLTFDENMDKTKNPVVTFGVDSPYTDCTVTAVGWTDDIKTEWTGTCNILDTMDEGVNTIKVSIAEDEAGNMMVADTATTFVIDTSPPTEPDDLVATATDVSVTIDWTASTDTGGSGVVTYSIECDDSEIGTVDHLTTTYVDYSLTTEGTYSYTVTAIDDAGNTAESDPVEIFFTPGDVIATEITLSEGWNLISLPLIPEDSDIEALLVDILDDVTSVWSYNAVTEVWSSYSTLPDAPEDLITMVDGVGYWVSMDDDATLVVRGRVLPEPPATPPTYDVVEGWNLIGFKSLETDVLSHEYMSGIAEDCVRMWSFVDGAYVSVDLTGSASTAKLVPGLGYWIAMTDAGTIYP